MRTTLNLDDQLLDEAHRLTVKLIPDRGASRARLGYPSPSARDPHDRVGIGKMCYGGELVTHSA